MASLGARGGSRMVKPRRAEPHSAAGEHGNLHVSARDLLESVPDAVVGVDREGRIAFVNVQTEEMFGYERREMLGEPVELLLPDHLKSAHAQHREVYHANPTTRPMGVGLNLLARRKDGSEFPVEISLSPLETRTGIQVISAIRDVTHRREIETERDRLLDVAEHALGTAEAALQGRAQAERLKDDLTNMVVHDLKNPLNGIAMMVQLALRKGGTGMSETQRNYLLQIDRSGREMMRLLLNLLEISKIESGQMPAAREPITLAAVAEEVAEEYAAVAEQTGRRLVVTVEHSLPLAVGDRALLKRVLINLVMNALRHSGSQEVRVEAMHDSVAARLALQVIDHGRGIAWDDQAHVFEKFASIRHGDDRGPSSDTGLGLPFCKLATERMGGEIRLNSHPETGTVFTITLPSQLAGEPVGSGGGTPHG